MEQFKLANGLVVPQVGFGTYKAADGEDERALQAALAAGYRYFDTASFYGTEGALGRAILGSNIPRAQCQIASKLWKDEMGYDNALRACEATLARLKTDYLDVYLIHWPRPDLTCDWQTLCRDTWRALEHIYEQGMVRAIGVSNFLPHHLETLCLSAKVAPMIDQIEFHPGYTQPDAVAYCRAHNILPQAWSPIGRARMLNDPVLIEIAAAHAVSQAQVCLRFAVQCGVMPLPKSSSPARAAQNLDLFSFTLTDAEIARICAMPQAGWSGEHPDHARVAI